MDKPERVVLTEEAAKKFGVAYNELFQQALAQLAEHKLWLEREMVALDAGITEEHRSLLLSEVAALRLESVMVEPAVRDIHDKPTVSVVYEYGDALHAYLSSRTGKANLAGQGGITLEEKPQIKLAGEPS